jgi:two-component system, NarL family, nitrate/nitrite response regulator NarL
MRLFLIVDPCIYREGLARALAQDDGIEVVGASAVHRELAARIGEAAPDVLLVDLSSAEALSLIEDVVDGTAAPHVVALGAPETESAIIECVEAGVSAFVPAESSFPDLLATLAGVDRGESVLSPRVAATLMRRVRAVADAPVSQNGARLTAREREILRLIDRGLSNKEIARRLSIEISTVKNHVHHILAKLEVGRRTEAPAKARAARVHGIARTRN